MRSSQGKPLTDIAISIRIWPLMNRGCFIIRLSTVIVYHPHITTLVSIAATESGTKTPEKVVPLTHEEIGASSDAKVEDEHANHSECVQLETRDRDISQSLAAAALEPGLTG